MSKAIVFIADGTEEVECLTTVDLLRRAGVETVLVSIMDSKTVISSHKVEINADSVFVEEELQDADLLFVPGGMPGTLKMSEHEGLERLLRAQAAKGKRVAAVCAGPSVLGKAGLLKGKKATCFPGWEDKLDCGEYTGEGVVTDGLITTGRGLGFSIELGRELIRLLEGEETALDMKKRIQHPESV